MHVTMIVTANYIGQEGERRKGDRIRVNTERARDLIRIGVARIEAAPSEVQSPAAPAAQQAVEPEEKKSHSLCLQSPSAGPSTPSASSSAHGPGAPSSASPAGRASRPRRSRRASARGSLPLQ